MQNENIHMDLVDDYINLLLKDCTPMQYSHSMIRISDIMMIKSIAQISETTIANYKSLDRLIPKFKKAVIHGFITVTLAIDLAKLDDLSQYDLYKKLKRNGIDICKNKVDSKLLAIFINEKILSM